MKQSWFSEEQVIAVLKEHLAGIAVADICRKHGISDATFYNWRNRYASRRSDDLDIRDRRKTLAGQRRRFGYPLAVRQLLAIAARRRLHILLQRDGIALNHKKLFRLYREERLTVRRRGGRKRARDTGADDHAAGTEPALESRLCRRRAR